MVAASGIIEDGAQLEERKRNKMKKLLANICDQNRGFLMCLSVRGDRKKRRKKQRGDI